MTKRTVKAARRFTPTPYVLSFVLPLLIFPDFSSAQTQTPSPTPSPIATENTNPSSQESASTTATPEASTNPTPSPTAAENANSSSPGTLPPTATPEGSAETAMKKMSLEELMNVDVTSVSKQPQPYGEAPAAIDVITNDEIIRSGASSIPEALRLADNLEVDQKNSHDWAISARGFNTDLANKLLVLMDGRTLYTPLFAGVLWDTQDYLMEDIDRIEVISGPGGTLWGANAVNGVINIITKSAKDTQGIYVEGGGGTELQDFTGVRYGGVFDSNIFYRFYGKYFDEGDENFYPSGNVAPDSWHMGQGGFRMDALASSDETFTLQGDYYNGNQNISTGGNSQTSGGNVLGRWSRTFSDDSNLSLQSYYEQTYLDDPIPADVTDLGVTLAPSGPLVDTLDTYDIDLQYRFHLNDWNNLISGLGYQFTHEVDQAAPGLAYDPSTLDQNLYNAFAQDEMLLAKNFSFIFGSKLEHNDYTGFEVEPSARVKWDVDNGQMLWAAVSRAVRMPSRVDEDEQLSTPKLDPFGYQALLTGSSDFVSEILIAYELGYRAEWNRKLSTSISTFFNNYTDIRSTGISPPNGLLDLPLPYVFQNNLLAQTGGVELTTDYQVLEGWRLHAGYDLLQENVWVKPGTTDINNALNETADPPNQVFLRSSMDLPGDLEFDPAFRWIDSIVYNNNGAAARVPSYAELDARLGWNLTSNLEISVTGQNLLHYEHVEYLVSGTNQNEWIQRSVYGKVTCRF